MLVLTRKQQQEIIIADNIRISVVEIRGGRVKIGITAPEHVSVRREELEKRSDWLELGEPLVAETCS